MDPVNLAESKNKPPLDGWFAILAGICFRKNRELVSELFERFLHLSRAADDGQLKCGAGQIDGQFRSSLGPKREISIA